MRWPEDALAEVAEKFLGDMPLPDEHKAGLAQVCSFSHSTSIAQSDKMRAELKRVFYVTPTNYIELLKAYGTLLGEKKQ